MTYKCYCCDPDMGNWSVIRISGRDRIVRCEKCRQVWHTTAAYAAELPEMPIPTYQRRKLIKTADYHKGELPVNGRPNGYLSPDFQSRFTEDNP